MKSYIDVFYEILHKNSVKRRRLISLMLVLSLFVSTGVLWELRDIGITMVNEPICGMEEHTHTEECYEDVLVCGLEENEEHTHTPECFQSSLICGKEEHIHTASCFTDEELPQYEPDDYDSNVVMLDTSEGESEEENFDTEDVPALQLGSEMMTALDGESNKFSIKDMTTPTLYEKPVDNIARGIKFTLFDYYESGDALEAAQNNYDMKTENVNGQDVYGHHNIKYEGVNYDKNANDDILFFAYGTPPDHGETTIGYLQSQQKTAYTDANGKTVNPGDFIDKDGNKVEEDANKVPCYNPGTPDMNNYAGDYRVNSYRSGNRPVQGIVNNTLTSGYPTIKKSSHSLDYLFNDTEYSYKKVYPNVNYLLKNVTIGNSDHLVYNSNENYAYFDQSSGNFKLYDGTYHIINSDHHRAKDTNKLTDETYETAKGYEMGIGFFPFNEYNPDWRDPNFNGNGFNHHFGLKMDAEFINKPVTGDPVIFKYSGDDDMWIFVDDVLVLDIGGIHEPAEGIIDFTNGFVWVQDNAKDNTNSKTKDQVLASYPALKDSGRFPDHIFPNGWNTEGNKWIVKELKSIFTGTGKTWDDTVGAKHTIKMFYLERGGCYSNLAIDMNLPTVKPLSVVKNVDYKGHYSTDYDKRENDGQIYQFEIQQLTEKGYTKASFVGVDNPFNLKDGERIDIPLTESDSDKIFRVIEKNVNTEVFENVKINGEDNNCEASSDLVDIESTGNAFGDVNSYNFTNVIREEKTNITVNKSWVEENGNTNVQHNEVINFKLYQTDSRVSGGTATTKQVEIKGNMTFSLKAEDQYQYTFENLPTRYGDHIYTYSVKEINSPDKYVVSYMKNGNNITIKNVDKTDAKIWVEKQWINTPDSDKAPVTLTLKRKKAAITNSEDNANLTINLLDPGNNQISTVNKTGLYVGGSVEFTITSPGSIEYYRWDNDYKVGDEWRFYKLSNASLGFKELGDRWFEVSNLQSGENTVNIKIKTDNANDSLLLLHHSFTRELDGWEANGIVPPESFNYDVAVGQNNETVYANLITSGGSAYAKGDGLLVRGRTQDWNGARLKLDPLKFKVNHTYTFSVYVKYDGTGYYRQASVPDNVNFVMTFNDGREGASSYHYVTSKSVHVGEWTQLIGTVTLPSDINPYGMFLLIETSDTDNNSDNLNGPEKFRMDEFVAVEGNKNISVESGTGRVSVSLKPYYDDPFGDNDFNGWESFGGTTLSIGEYQEAGKEKDYYVLITGRDNVSDGMMKKVPLLMPGQKYRFHADVSGNTESSQDTHLIGLSINKRNLDPNNQEYSNFKNIVVLDKAISGYGWGTLEAVYTIPSEADRDGMYLYFESPQNSGDTRDFRVWNFKVTDPDDFTQQKTGYTLSNPGINGVYTSDNSQYGVTLDEASITAQQLYSDNYTDDTDWSYTVTLTSDSWKTSISKSVLDKYNTSSTDAESYRYVYYVASETVGGVGDKTEGVDYILLPIENNYVSANDADTPILVKNQNIRFKLPATGGRGTVGIYVVGTVLITISLFSGYAVYRQKRRRE